MQGIGSCDIACIVMVGKVAKKPFAGSVRLSQMIRLQKSQVSAKERGAKSQQGWEAVRDRNVL